jgi:hypothetical protein
MLALCSQDGIGFMESFFINLLKVFRYLVIVMLDWNLPDEGLRSLKFVAHITMPRNSVPFCSVPGSGVFEWICDGAPTAVCCLRANVFDAVLSRVC